MTHFHSSHVRVARMAVISLWLAAGVQAVVHADTANFQVNGQIAAGTCSLSAADQNRTITLPTMGVKDMPASGKAEESRMPFSLTVENCPAGLSRATFTFAGTPDPTDGLRYRSTGTAPGVAIELESAADGQTIGANGTNNARTVTIAGTSAVLDLEAFYWRLPGVALKSGSVRSVATVEVTYE